MSQQRVLYLLRHAKSSWDDPSCADHDRELAGRGRRAVRAVAGYLDENQIRPELILCSPARRAVQTLQGVYPGTGGGWAYHHGQVTFDHVIYDGTPSAVFRRLQAVPTELRSIMVIGHNPTLQILATGISCDDEGDEPEHDAYRRRLTEKLPTAALVTLAFEGSWLELGRRCAQITGFVTPKELQDA